MNETIKLLAGIGLTHILVDSTLMAKYIKPYLNGFFNLMLACYQCTGFWAGLVIGLLTAKSSGFDYFVDAVGFGLVISFLAPLGAIIMNHFNEQLPVTREPATKATEVLTHFNCVHCGKWWSISEAPDRSEWHCPWCGGYQGINDEAHQPRSDQSNGSSSHSSV